MIITNHHSGLFFKLETRDFRGMWKLFLARIKRLKTVQYNPPEMPDDNWWFVGSDSVNQFRRLKDELIDEPLRQEQEWEEAGYKPSPQSGGRFARRRIV